MKLANYFLEYTMLILLVIISLITIPIIGLILKIQKFDSIIFEQKRIGYNAKVFTLYKIKTLDKNLKMTNFSKLLRLIGIDELPQIINIIKGDMNIFGPRPKPIQEYYSTASEHKGLYLYSRKPGLFSLYISTIGPGRSLYVSYDNKVLILKEIQRFESLEISHKSKFINFIVLYYCIKSIWITLNSLSSFPLNYDHSTIKLYK